MEYKMEEMRPVDDTNIFQKFWQFARSPHHTRTLGVLAFLILIAAVPLTVYVAQKQQEIRQRASGFSNGNVQFVDINGNPLPSTISNTNVYLKITEPDGWTSPQASLPLAQKMSIPQKAYAASGPVCGSAGASPNPQTVGGNVTISAAAQSPSGIAMQFINISIKDLSGGLNHIGTIPCSGTGNCSGSVTWSNTSNYDPGTYTVVVNPWDVNGNQTNPGGKDSSCNLPGVQLTAATTNPTVTLTPTQPAGGGATSISSCNITPRSFAPNSSPLQMDINFNSTVAQLSHILVAIQSNGGSGWTQVADGTVNPAASTFNLQLFVGDKGFIADNVSRPVKVLVNDPSGTTIIDNSSACGSVTVTGGSTTPTTTPPGSCTPWNNASSNPPCTLPGGNRCSDFGGNGYCGFDNNAYIACRNLCQATNTIAKINIANVDSNSSIQSGDGTAPQLLTTKSQFDYALGGTYAWKLNSVSPGQTATRYVNVGFTDTNGNTQTAQASITLTNPNNGGGGTPTATPTGLPPGPNPGACKDLPPDQTNPLTNSSLDPNLYVWKVQPDQNSCTSQPSCYNGENAATYNDKCAQYKNTSQPGFVNPNNSYWCYGFKGSSSTSQDFRCLTLTYIGPGSNPPTNPPLVSQPPIQSLPTITLTPTATIPPGSTATPTITITPTGVTPGASAVSFSVILSGIGPQGSSGSPTATWNPNPVDKTRSVTIYIYDKTADPASDLRGANAKYAITANNALVFNGSDKFVATNVNLGNSFVPGEYQILVKTPGYLRKRIGGVQTINTGNNQLLETQTPIMLPGDTNDDNAVNWSDWTTYTSCLINPSSSCKNIVDFNDDGTIDSLSSTPPDQRDYSLFINSFIVHNGD